MSVQSGWGRFTWGQAYWNRDAILATGWGAKAWNDGEWGNLADETVSLTGISATSNIGAVGILANCFSRTNRSFFYSINRIYFSSYTKNSRSWWSIFSIISQFNYKCYQCIFCCIRCIFNISNWCNRSCRSIYGINRTRSFC